MTDIQGPIAFVNRLSPEAEQNWLAKLGAALPGETVVPFRDLTEAERAEARLAIVANPDPAELRALPNLHWVQSLWAGVERMVAELPGYSVPVVRMVDPQLAVNMSEAALAWTFYLFRDMPGYGRQQAEKLWKQRPYRRASDVTVGVLGLGELGAASATRIRAQGFPVLGWSRSQKSLAGVECLSGEAGLARILAESDILLVLLPLTEATRGLLDAGRLGQMKPGAALINFARGPIINEAALLAALTDGRLEHAVLDVFAQEPLPVDAAFWDHPKVTVLPHISAPTDPATGAAIVAENIASWRREGKIPPAVDMTLGY